MAMGQKAGYPSANIPTPTKIGSKMGGAPTPSVFDPQPQLRSHGTPPARRLLVAVRRDEADVLPTAGVLVLVGAGVHAVAVPVVEDHLLALLEKKQKSDIFSPPRA